MAEIVLTTLNARYSHAAFGLRCLMANLGPLQSRSEIVEFDINQRPIDIVAALLERDASIVGFGVYIWNVRETTEVVAMLKRLRPAMTVILGGPEVSHETETQPIVALADHVITGEADLKFAEVCRELVDRCTDDKSNPLPKVMHAALPDVNSLASPYGFYDDRDIAHRIVYVEASRGCPFTCEFCLSSLDVPVRSFALEPFLADMERLLERGMRQFKFVDRTFNLNLQTSRAILEFFLQRMRPGLFVHFEMVPDRLPEPLREVIAKFPAGSLQFEVGIQTFNPEVGKLISRRQNCERLEDNLRWLRRETGVHVHADLIVGLPGESIESFGVGFDRLLALGPQEVQVGILKRLRGTPIIRHDAEWGMIYSPHPPYEILQTRLVDFNAMQRMRHFARYWDLVANSGNFTETIPLLWCDGASPFHRFLEFSDWLYARAGRHHGIALVRLLEFIFEHLTKNLSRNPHEVAAALWNDYQRTGHSDRPPCIRDYLPEAPATPKHQTKPSGPKRQSRHMAAAR